MNAADYRKAQAKAMTEDELMRHIQGAARDLGWRFVHFRPAQTTKGWRTPVQGDGVGFPDVLLLRRERGLAVELKREGKYPRREQIDWLSAFAGTGWEQFTWWPADWLEGRIEAVLR